MDIEKILNKRSNAVVTDGGGVETPVKPTSSQLDNGEIAVNYHKGTERLFIKNDNEEVVEFVSKDEVDKKLDKVDGVNIVRKEFKDDSGRWTEGVIEIDNGVYNTMLRPYEIDFTSGSKKGEIFFEPIGHTIDGKNFPGGVKCKHKKTDDPFNNDLRIARMCDLPSQVQSDWNETNTTSKAYILNKPTIPSKTSELNNDSKFVSEDYIEPITKQFIGEITDNVSDYNKYFGGGPITLLGEWTESTNPTLYVTTNTRFGISFNSNFKHLYMSFGLTSTYETTGAKVTVKDGDTVLFTKSIKDGGYSTQLTLSLTNNENTKEGYIELDDIGETRRYDIVITSDILNFEVTDVVNKISLYMGEPYGITYEEIIKKLNLVAFSGSYNDLTNTPTIPTITYIVEHTTEETTIDALTPNVLHKWGTMTSLTISALATPSDETVVNEYMIEFTSGSTATVLSLPSSIVWTETPNIEANATYQISVINNLGIIVKFG